MCLLYMSVSGSYVYPKGSLMSEIRTHPCCQCDRMHIDIANSIEESKELRSMFAA